MAKALPPFILAMGYHLQGDIQHDFERDYPIYNIGGNATNTLIPGTPKIDEDSVVAYFLTGPGKVMISNVDARSAGSIEFPVVTKTSSFTPPHPPVLYAGGNDKIGIVQDAGEIITGALGAKNVLTFGSILDPAGKPVSAATNPIWFQPTVNDVDIPLVPFGFDPSAVQSIRVRNLTAGTVQAAFMVGNPPRLMDAVSMDNKIAATAKPINKTDIAKSGFFVGIEKAAGLDKLLREDLPEKFGDAEVRKKFTDAYRRYFYVAKTLGDTMLVASCMPSFPNADLSGSIPNPFYGLPAPDPRGPGQWKSWVSGEGVDPPSILMMKTGDRLNHLRAILFNVPTIYEQQAKAGRGKHYVFFPGQADPDAIITAILDDFRKLKNDVNTLYNNLKSNLKTLADQLLLSKGLVSNFAPGGMKEISAKVPAENCKIVLGEVEVKLEESRNSVVSWIDSRNKTIAQKGVEAVAKAAAAPEQADNIKREFITALKQYYSVTVLRANACSPQTDTIFIKPGTPNQFLSSKVIVVNTPPGAPGGVDGYPLTQPMDISLRNAFNKINKTRAPIAYPFPELAGTDIVNRFFSRNTAAGPVAAAASAGDMTSVGQIQATVNEFSPAPAVAGVGGGKEDMYLQKGGAQMSVAFRNIDVTTDGILDMIKLFPRINDFIGYIRDERITKAAGTMDDFARYIRSISPTDRRPSSGIEDPQFWFLIIYDVLRRRNTHFIEDPVLLEELLGEFRNICYPSLASKLDVIYAIARTRGDRALITRALADGYADSGYVVINYGDPMVFIPSFTSDPSIGNVPTQSTDIFNAYTNYVNGYNSRAFGPDDPETESTLDFFYKEYLYLSRLALRISRSGRQVLTATQFQAYQYRIPTVDNVFPLVALPMGGSDTPIGGLRPRRPLYSNARGSDSLPLLTDNNPGLRKRSRTRRTRRVRQSTRKSKTRR
jgi:hypothetical protein